jgi:hypothetical protein
MGFLIGCALPEFISVRFQAPRLLVEFLRVLLQARWLCANRLARRAISRIAAACSCGETFLAIALCNGPVRQPHTGERPGR